MASADNTELMEHIAEIVECPICTDKISNNRVLPCGHTFCYKCLAQYKKSSRVKGKSIGCPVCRKECKIPKGGCAAFPKNRMIEKFLEVKADYEDIEALKCDFCKSGMSCGVYCIQCEQNLCDNCEKFHANFKMTSGHQVTPVTKTSQNKVTHSPLSHYCEHHPGHLLELMCDDCDTPICWKCRAFLHYFHHTVAIQDVIEEQHKQLRSCIDQINDRLLAFNKFSESILDQEIQCRQIFEKEKSNVHKVSQDLIRSIEQNESGLLIHINARLTRKLKTFGPHRQWTEKQIDRLKEHKACLEQLNVNGNDWEIFNRTTELHYRSTELVSVDLPVIRSNNSFSTNMSDADIQRLLMQNLEISQDDGPRSFPMDQRKISSSVSNLAIGCYKDTDQGTNENDQQGIQKQIKETPKPSGIDGPDVPPLKSISLENDSAVSAVAVSKQKIFVAIETDPDIVVFRADNHQMLPKLKIPGKCWDLAFCQQNDCLYLADWETRSILSVKTEGAQKVKCWSTGGDFGGISMTPDDRLLLCCHDSSSLQEYDLFGKPMTSIEILSDKAESIHPWHALKLSSDKFIISHGAKGTLHRVCLLNSEGAVLKSFGGHEGSGVDRLFGPYHLAIDQNQLFVADCNNKRILILDTDFNYVGKISTDLRKPRRLSHFCSNFYFHSKFLLHIPLTNKT